jgi:Ni2+-binding GTPase involved in maturation of urease and hydrogenase
LNSGNHFWAGRFEDYLVCQHCCENSFVRAIGADREEYLTNEDNCQHINGEWYVTRFFAENQIVLAVDTDEYCHEDDCLFLDHRQEWVSSDCSYAVYCESSGNHEHADDCFVNDDGEYVLIDDQSNEAAA